jgi:vacuolar-type H+-ATPase subunit E/Vma4
MSLTALKEAILSQATAQAHAIEKQSSVRVRQEQKKTTTALRDLEEGIVGQAREEGQRKTRTIHQQAELSGRALILNAKQEELEKTAEVFVEHLLNLSAKKSKALHESLIATLPETKGIIVAGEYSKDILTGIKTVHALSKETIPKEGGFIFKGKNVEINSTFSYLTKQIFADHKADIAHELFS